MNGRQEHVFNLARRYTQENEPDLLQEEIVATTPPSSPFTKKGCMEMFHQVSGESPLPTECEQYEDIKMALQRRNSKQGQAIAFQGMHAGEAAAAMAARDHGHCHHAQIQRRMTNTKNRTLW